MDLAKPLVIVNPRARGHLSEKAWARLVGQLAEGLGAIDVRFTERPRHAREIAREAASAGRTLVVACGGDGTISEVADGLMAAGPAHDAELGILPRGTGGDFRRTLALPEDLAAAARHLKGASVHLVDVGRATYTSHDGSAATCHFVNAASFGFSAAVATRANASSKRFGATSAFLGAALRSLASYDNVDVLVSLDGGEPRRRTLLLGAVGNGRYFGGGMKICPEAQLDDGRFDVVLAGDFGRFELLTKIGTIYAGTHTKLEQVDVARARSVDVKPADPEARIQIELDGETLGHLPATFEMVPRALRLRF